MAWTIDDAGVLTNSDGNRTYSRAEFARQTWPPCPRCGGRLLVEPMHTPDLTGTDKYIPGPVRCTGSCSTR